MIQLENYFKKTSPKVKKVGLWLKGIIGTAAGSAYIQDNVKLAFFLLMAGALVTGLLELLPPDDELTSADKSQLKGAAVIALMLVSLMLLVSSCRVIKPETDTVKTDSTSVSFTKQIVNVKGAKVTARLNIDSLLIAAKAQRAQWLADSAKYADQLQKYRADSAAAAVTGKQFTERKPVAPPKPQTQSVTDPQTKAQLTYWIDKYDNLQVGCESKDQAIDVLNAQVDHLKTSVTTKTVIVNKTPAWCWVLIAVEGVLLLILIIVSQLKKDTK